MEKKKVNFNEDFSGSTYNKHEPYEFSNLTKSHSQEMRNYNFKDKKQSNNMDYYSNTSNTTNNQARNLSHQGTANTYNSTKQSNFSNIYEGTQPHKNVNNETYSHMKKNIMLITKNTWEKKEHKDTVKRIDRFDKYNSTNSSNNNFKQQKDMINLTNKLVYYKFSTDVVGEELGKNTNIVIKDLNIVEKIEIEDKINKEISK